MLIGLTGYARVGKDSVADFMVRDYDFVKMSFADPMREALVALDPLIRIGENMTVHLSQALNSLGWDDLKAVSPDIRPLLQRLGTDVGRNMFGENFWVDLAMDKAGHHENVVFADVRFKNEADAIVNAGGIIVRVKRPNFGPANNHVSEIDMDDYGSVQYEVANKADLDALSVKVNVFVAAMSSWSNA